MAQSPPPVTGLGGKSPLRGPFGLFLPAYRGRAEVTSLYSPPSRRIPAPRPGLGNASAIYSRTEASLKALSYSEATLSLLLSNYWGTLSPVGRGHYRARCKNQRNSTQSGGNRHCNAPGNTSMRNRSPLSGSPSRLKVMPCGAITSNHADFPSMILGLSSGCVSVVNSAGSSPSPVKCAAVIDRR